ALFQSTFSRQIQDLRGQLDRASLEMLTGRRADVSKATRGNNQTLLQAQAAIDAAEPERARIAVLEGRYRTAGLALETIRNLSENAALTAQGAGDLAAGVDADRFAATEAKAALAAVFSTFEARFGGRSLFGGDLGSGRVLADVTAFLAEVDTAVGGATSAADVTAAIDSVLAPGGAFETSIYLGGDPAAEAELADGSRLGEIFTAASDNMRQLYKGLAMAAFNGSVDLDERSAFLQDSAEIVLTANEDMVAEEASIGISLLAIERERDRQDQLLFQAELTMDTVLGRDPFEAASETQSLEAKLQAAYTVTGRIGSLRLTNFLR
ncbi:MAG: hypothetical protein AAF317_19605, partial [Pseudomonadota bacterium]